nr:reverse transcriptase domain-containing protein [Tanacetum cinerariifolium]
MMKKSSSLENEPCCSKDCKKNTNSLNNKKTELKSELSDSNTYWYSYKLGVVQLEERLNEYKDREEKYIVKIRTLEMYRESNLENIKILTNEVETLKEEKDVVDGKLARLRKSLKDLEDIIENQRSDKVKEGVGYNVVPPPAADLYRSLKKDLSWTGLPEFADDTVTDYSRPSPTIETKSEKSSIDEPPEVELKDLPHHLEYVFLEGDDKLPVIITKDLIMEEKTSLITVLKSHKRAIAWKIFDIKCIDPEFCTHKILIEEEFEPAIQH